MMGKSSRVLGVLMTAGWLGATVPTEAAESKAAKPAEPRALRALVLTGGHAYDKPTFNAMCRSLHGIECRVAPLPKAGEEFAPSRRDGYDVLVLYDMMQTISDEHAKDLADMLQQGKGVVIVHHALAARQAWDEYYKILGGRYNTKPGVKLAGKPDRRLSSYQHDVWMNVLVKDKTHPITAGLCDWRIFDEVYKDYDLADDVHVLLGTDNPKNDPTLAWTRPYGKSRVVYLQLGHGPGAFNDGNYRELLARSIRWVLERPDKTIATPGFRPEPATPPMKDEGTDWIRLFDGKSFDGWEIMGDKAGWEILKGGIIRSDGAKGGNWLRYAKADFDDFILRVQWRVSVDGNSGVFIRAKRRGAPWITGHEIQISNAPRDDAHCTASLYGSVAVKPRPDESPGRWHEFEIRAEGEHLVVVSDGVKVVDATYAKNEALRSRPLRGCVGLQDAHAGPDKWIEWRNVRLKRLGK